MGIKNLTSFLKTHCPSSIKEINLVELKDKKAAIDVSIFLYKFKYKGNNLVIKFVEQINRLRVHNITPIYIFDGIPTSEKKDVISERKEKINIKAQQISELKQQLDNTPSTEINKLYEIKTQITKINRTILKVSKEDIVQVKYLFDLLNIKHVRARGEADALCSKMCKEGVVDFVISEDMDLLTSGAKYLLRDFNIYNNKATLYNLEEIIEKLNLTYEKWVELCIMFGCDYLKRINGIGPNKSFKFIKDNLSINEIVNKLKEKNVEVEENYIEKFNKAKDIFLNYDISYLGNDLNNFVKIEPLFNNQKENIIKFLNENTNLSNKKIDNRIKNIFNNI